MRVLGALLLVLAAPGRLSRLVPFSAGWGDIITRSVRHSARLDRGSVAKAPAGAIMFWSGTLALLVAVEYFQ